MESSPPAATPPSPSPPEVSAGAEATPAPAPEAKPVEGAQAAAPEALPRKTGPRPPSPRRRRDAEGSAATSRLASLRWVVLSLALVAGITFLFRGAVYRSLARGDGQLSGWAAGRLLDMRDPGAFDVYVLHLGRDSGGREGENDRVAFASIVPELAGRDALAPGEDLDAPAPPELPELQVEHRAIIRATLDDPRSSARRGGLYALMMLRNRPWTRDEEMLLAVSARLSDEDVVARRYAALVLGGGPPPEAALPALLTATLPAEPDPRVRRFAVRALAGSAHPSARSALLTALQDPAQEVRDEASLGLVQSDQEVSIEVLGGLLRRSPAGTRAQVLQAIARSSSPDAAGLLLEGLEDTRDPSARLAAVEGLAAREGADVRAGLLGALEDEKHPVRLAATRALRGRADAREASLPALLAALVRAQEAATGWNELLEHHLTLKALTGEEVPPPTPDPATWEPSVAGWRRVVEGPR